MQLLNNVPITYRSVHLW